MDIEVQKAVFRALLRNLNQGIKTFTVADINAESDEESDSDELKKVLSEIAADGILKTKRRNPYVITADIETLRNYIVRREQTVNEAKDDNKVALSTIIDSNWTLCDRYKIGEDTENDDTEFDFIDEDELNDFRTTAQNLERRRRELLRRLKESDDIDGGDGDFGKFGQLCKRALKYCIEQKAASVEIIKRRFSTGLVMSRKIMEWMEENEFVTPKDGSGQYDMLISMKEFKTVFGDGIVEFGEDMQFTVGEEPSHSLWDDEEEFVSAVADRIRKIVLSDIRMDRQGAARKAESCLKAVRDIHDRKMVQVYERIVYEFKTASDYVYRQLKKQIFGEGK